MTATIAPFDAETIADALAYLAELTNQPTQARAFTKAEFILRRGLDVMPTRNGWLVPSNSRANEVFRVTIDEQPDGDALYRCSCEAGDHQRGCWHAALVFAIYHVDEKRREDDHAGLLPF